MPVNIPSLRGRISIYLASVVSGGLVTLDHLPNAAVPSANQDARRLTEHASKGKAKPTRLCC